MVVEWFAVMLLVIGVIGLFAHVLAWVLEDIRQEAKDERDRNNRRGL